MQPAYTITVPDQNLAEHYLVRQQPQILNFAICLKVKTFVCGWLPHVMLSRLLTALTHMGCHSEVLWCVLEKSWKKLGVDD